jgi:hypothetical protein
MIALYVLSGLTLSINLTNWYSSSQFQAVAVGTKLLNLLEGSLLWTLFLQLLSAVAGAVLDITMVHLG